MLWFIFHSLKYQWTKKNTVLYREMHKTRIQLKYTDLATVVCFIDDNDNEISGDDKIWKGGKLFAMVLYLLMYY